MLSSVSLIKSSGSLAQKMVLCVLVVNAGLSVFAAGIQLYASYHREKANVLKSIDVIDKSFRISIEDALWEYNYGLLDALVDGIFNRADVAYVELMANDGQRWVRGSVKNSDASL